MVTQLLLHCLHRAIAQYETALPYCMGMQVYIDETQLACRIIVDAFLCQSLVQLGDYLLGCKNCRLQGWVRIFIVPVKILVAGVISEVTSVNSIWIQTRNDLEHKIISKSLSRLIISKIKFKT